MSTTITTESAAVPTWYVRPGQPVVKEELFDADRMQVILNDNSFASKHRRMLSAYNRARLGGNRVKVHYEFGKGCEELQVGRLYVKNEMGLQGFPFDIRNPLLEKYYWDVDMENCHYNLLVQFGIRAGVKVRAIQQYCENRDAELAKLGSNRSLAKTAFLKVAYGGSIAEANELWGTRYTEDLLPADADTTLLKEIEKELETIKALVYGQHPELHSLVKGKKKLSPQNSVFALVLQSEERKCLLTMERYFETMGRNVDILIHDGLEIRKKANEESFPVELLRGAEEAIRQETGYSVKLVVKPFYHNFVDPSEPKDNEYEEMKCEFEKEYFKLMNPPCFVRIVDGSLTYLKHKDLIHQQQNLLLTDGKSFISRWVVDPKIRTYEKLVYMPKQLAPSGAYNLFSEFKVAEEAGDVRAVHELLRLVSGNDKDAFDYIEKWMAHIIQKPYEKTKTCIVVQGEEGVGKDTYFDFVGSILGREYYYSTSSPENNVFNRFNHGLEKSLLVKFEEANFTTNKTNVDKLKYVITSETENYEKKGHDAITLDDYRNFVMTTNNEVPVVISETDRRFVLIKASSERRGDSEFWDCIHEVLAKPETKAAYHHYLLNLDISEFKPTRDRVITEYYQDTKQSFIPYHARFFQRIVEDAYAKKELNDYEEAQCIVWKGRELYDLLNEFAKGKFEISETKFGREMKLYNDANSVIKKRSGLGIQYTLHPETTHSFLKSKGWWVEI